MKKLTTILLGAALLCCSISFGQTKEKKENPYVEGEFLVQLNAGANLKTLLQKAPKNFNLELDHELSAPMRIWLLSYDEVNNNSVKMENWLYAQEEVSIVDYNVYVEQRATTPGDANFTDQWHHVNTGQTGGTADADIDSDLAWDITTGGQTATNDDIVVCMIESGNLDHIDLAPNRWVNTGEIPNNGQDDDGNGYIDDYNGWNPTSNDDDYGNGGHGTNCLGMIGAKGDNNSLVVGANWDVKLMVVGDYNAGTQAAVIEAYTYPLVMRQRWNNSNGTEGAFVVATSASWGLDNTQASTRPLWCQFYDTLGLYGILNVGATTNNNTNVDVDGDVPTQCSSPYMIGVGRTDHNDQWEGGYGVTTIDFGAPGVDVVTTAGSNGITSTTGTSFSCPLTAGVIGLAYSIPCADFMTIVKNNPQTGADLVLDALLNGVDVKANLSNRYITSGRLNAKNTLDLLMNVGCSGDLCLPPSGSANVTGDNTASITFTPFLDATATTFFWRAVGTPTWTEVSSATSPISLTSLSECTEYEFYATSTCGAETSSNSSIQTFKTTGCGLCVEAAYCSSTTTNTADEWIDEVVIGTFTNNSGQDNGYGDFTATNSIDLNMDQAYNFTITPEWDNGNAYDEQTRIWIDLNQNGTFEASEMIFDQGAADQNNVTGSITIPTTATTGNTRMRIQMAYIGAGQTDLPDVCGNFQWGEVEDYCVNIIDPTQGVNEYLSQYVNVYPNPSNDIVNFNITSNLVAQVEITDLLGKVIRSSKVNSSLTSIKVLNLSQGQYLYQLKDSQGAILLVDKLIVTK